MILRDEIYMYEGYEYHIRLSFTYDLKVRGILYHRIEDSDFYVSTEFWLAGRIFEQNLEAAQPLIDKEVAHSEKKLLEEIKRRESCQS